MYAYVHNITMYACVYTHMYSISSMCVHLFEACLCVHVMLYVLYNTASKFGATDDEGDDGAVNSDWEDCRHTLLTH